VRRGAAVAGLAPAGNRPLAASHNCTSARSSWTSCLHEYLCNRAEGQLLRVWELLWQAAGRHGCNFACSGFQDNNDHERYCTTVQRGSCCGCGSCCGRRRAATAAPSRSFLQTAPRRRSAPQPPWTCRRCGLKKTLDSTLICNKAENAPLGSCWRTAPPSPCTCHRCGDSRLSPGCFTGKCDINAFQYFQAALDIAAVATSLDLQQVGLETLGKWYVASKQKYTIRGAKAVVGIAGANPPWTCSRLPGLTKDRSLTPHCTPRPTFKNQLAALSGHD